MYSHRNYINKKLKISFVNPHPDCWSLTLKLNTIYSLNNHDSDLEIVIYRFNGNKQRHDTQQNDTLNKKRETQHNDTRY